MSKLKLLVYLSLIIMVITSMSGCNIVEDKNEADQFMKTYFDTIKSKDFDKALTLYSDKFYEKTSKEDWLKALNTINKKLGDLENYEQNGFNINTQVGTENSGTYYTFKYKVKYSKYDSVETFTLLRPTGKKEISILGHNINTDAFLKE